MRNCSAFKLSSSHGVLPCTVTHIHEAQKEGLGELRLEEHYPVIGYRTTSVAVRQKSTAMRARNYKLETLQLHELSRLFNRPVVVFEVRRRPERFRRVEWSSRRLTVHCRPAAGRSLCALLVPSTE